jgi:hypothetical protein
MDDFGFGFDPGWSVPDFNFQFPAFDFPAFDFGFGFDPAFAFPDFNWQFPTFDPLALPTMPALDPFVAGPTGGMQVDFSQFGIPPMEAQGIGGTAMSLADLGFGGSGAPSLNVPEPGLPTGSDSLLNLMNQYQAPSQGDFGLGMDPAMLDLGPLSPLAGGSAYGVPASPLPGLGGAGYTPPGGTPGAPMSEQEKFFAAQNARANTPPSKWDTLAKLGAAFGPVALGAAGLGLQAANRPERNPLEDELLRARIASSGQQDALAKERLAFEKENAARMLEAQMAMQAAMLESKKPGGQANIDALLKGNPQLAALYQALTSSSTGLASGGGSPEFLALVEQIAQTDIGELRRQADQQKAQAMEMAARQGINPANIIAEVEQRFLQESAKARANARNVLIAQMQPGVNVFNSVGGLFGNLFQTPSA